MLPQHHAAAAAIASLPLAQSGWGWLKVATFAAAAVLIDVDHYASYVVQTGDWSLERAYTYHHRHIQGRRRGFRFRWPGLWVEWERPCHAPPFILLLFLLAGRWAWLAPVAWGALFHRLLDYADEYAYL